MKLNFKHLSKEKNIYFLVNISAKLSNIIHFLLPILGVLLFIIATFLFFNLHMINTFSISDDAIVLLLLGGISLIKYFNLYASHMEKEISEYVDKLIIIWHKFVDKTKKEKPCIFTISLEHYNELNNAEKEILKFQFLEAIDIISIIYFDIKKANFIKNDQILDAWQETFFTVLFSKEIPVLLWQKYNNTIEDEGFESTRKWINSCILRRSQNTKIPVFALLGECYFTYSVLLSLIDNKVYPTYLAIEEIFEDDIFKNLKSNETWYKEHQLYHYGWKNEIKKICKENNIILIERKNALSFIPKSDIIIIAGYHKKVKKEDINKLNGWFLNVHPSKLPLFKGPQPEAHVIKSRFSFSAVSIHGIDENYDSGPLYIQVPFEIDKYDSIFDIENAEAKIAAFELAKIINMYPLLPNVIEPENISSNMKMLEHQPIFSENELLIDANNCDYQLMKLRPENYCYIKVNDIYYYFIDLFNKKLKKNKAYYMNNIIMFDRCVKKQKDKFQVIKKDIRIDINY